MRNHKNKSVLALLLAGSLTMSGCSVGTDNLYHSPAEDGFEYKVMYDTLGGSINQVKVREVYYAKDSLLFYPSGTSGMLIAPTNGKKVLEGWYTDCTKKETGSTTIYEFDPEDKWDFETERVNETTVPDKELTLYAHWIENPNIQFVDAEDLNQDPYLTWNIGVGEILRRPTSSEPKKKGYSFSGYYKDAACTIPYEFNQPIAQEDVVEEDGQSPYINIYCKFEKGEKVRIKNVEQFLKIAEDPEKEYILSNDIDFEGVDWTPIAKFSGTLDGNGYAIKNLSMKVQHRVAGIAARRAKEQSYGLFSQLDHATIKNLTMTNIHYTIDKGSNVAVCVGTVAGRTSQSTIKNCTFDNIIIDSNDACKADVTAAAIIAGDSTVKLMDCTMKNIQMDHILSNGKIELIKNELDN